VTVRGDIDAAWLAHPAAEGADAGERGRIASYGRLLDRIGPGAAVAAARLPDSGSAGIAFVVLERRWAGIFGMATYREARRRGVATALLNALARHADAGGAAQMYLQVEDGNDAARALYARAGFAPAYRYHYRSLGVRSAHDAAKEER
jgi:GNAT superfamily N-acetyltransferase